MKRTLILAALLATTAGLYAQGTLVFGNRVTGVLYAPIFNVNPTAPTIEQKGQPSNGLPNTGTTVYGGAALTGTGFTAELWAVAGANASEASLSAVTGSQVQFRTQTTAGVTGSFSTSPVVAVPGAPENALATLEVRVWDNKGGTITSWAGALAQSAIDNTYAFGTSDLFNSTGLGGTLTTPPNLVNMTSFSLHTAGVPEPTTMALWALGAGSLLLIRRRK